LNKITVEARNIKHGENISHITSLSIDTLLDILEIPDPNQPFEDNRRVKIKHAREFGDYWENQTTGWISPPIMLDSEEKLKTTKIEGVSDIVCCIEIPVANNFKLKILDGQHRILGWYLKKLEIKKRLELANSNFNRAVFNNDSNLRLRSKEEIENLEYLQKRMSSEHVGILIISGIDRDIHRQFFVDIAKNALGINKTVQAKFDVSSIVNRVTSNIMESHELLANRIDTESTKCSGDNENILSVVNLSDIVRHIGFGINKRVTAKKERDYNDDDLYQIAICFFNLMLENFIVLKQVQNETVSARWLRENSLLGSGTIWRCLAGAFHNFCVTDKMITEDSVKRNKLSLNKARLSEYENFLKQLSSNSVLPISKQWFATGYFPKKTSSGPTSRSQDLLGMVKLFQSWIESGELFKQSKSRIS
jgi:hypothetical protein